MTDSNWLPATCGILVLLSGCGAPDPQLPAAKSSLLDPDGGFTLYVSNQSYAIDRVDMRVEIDGELVVSDYFNVDMQHTFIPFKLALKQGSHKVHIWSVKGEVDFSEEFELNDHDVGVTTFWHDPDSAATPNRRIDFRTQVGPFKVM